MEGPGRVGLAVAAGGALLGIAALLARFPAAVPVLVLAAAPFRVPVEVGTERAFLLLPLYGALFAAALAFLYGVVRGAEIRPLPAALALPAALFVAVAAASLLWSEDARRGSIELLFFLFPFSALVAIVARAPFPTWMPRALASALVALAAVFSLFGFWQLWSRDLLFARDVEVANAYTTFFRVSSVFKDPSIYGRHLAIALVVLVVALWLGRLGLAIGTILVGVLFAGLYFSYSQSSMVALFVGVLAVTLLAADASSRRIVLVVAAAVALVGAGLVLASGRGDSLQDVTRGRSVLVENTGAVIRAHPIAGVGIGGEAKASRQEAKARGERLRQPSHTTPLTVAAELGVLGVAAYLAVLAGALYLLSQVRSRDRAVGLGLAGVFLVIFTHSLFYSGFFEDPLMWQTLAVAAAALASRRAVDVEAPRPTLTRPSAAAAVAGDSRSSPV